jgi:hypothetical protein
LRIMIETFKRQDGQGLRANKVGEGSGENILESENSSEEKPVEKPSGEKPSEQPQPKPNHKLVQFHCDYCGRDGHKGEFCFKRKREERMAKEWANKDKYLPFNAVLEPHVQMPRAKASVRTVLSWGE